MNSLPFHPLINAWFTEVYGKPTAVQEAAWPLIAGGEHVLALAPTGSGKTLTGFLAALSRLASGEYPAEELSVLYVSPLKALNEDIKRNLAGPIEGIRSKFEREGVPWPPIRAETRSGDTSQAERRRFLSRPPSVLALTPESLGIILLNPRGRQALSTVRYVILDEIHTALGSKRGAYLSCQIDRLSLVAGEFQRVALSATVRSPEVAAEFAGGLRKTGGGIYEGRKVHIVSPPAEKDIRFSVVFPGVREEAEGTRDSIDPGEAPGRYGRRYAALVRFLRERIEANKGGTVLVFTGSRRRAERLGYLLNQNAGKGKQVYTHHGSLSRETRQAVEKALASGEISCVVATGSLELGIDIGGVDEVILAGSPGSASQALQRIGRSGHGVGMTSRGCLVPFHGLDLLEAAAVAGAVNDRELEETGNTENPLDILAQIILAFCAERDWNEEELYQTLRGFYVFRNLSRLSYDGVVRMLAGVYEETRIRELKARIFRDELTGLLSAAPGALPLLYSSGGVIASRGYYSLRLASGAEGAGIKIGELDEEFVWERSLGDVFDFGGRAWKITAIGSEAVEALPLPGGAGYAPFWKGDSVYRSSVLNRRILELLDQYQDNRGGRGISTFTSEAEEALENFLAAQVSCQGKLPLAGQAFIPLEIIDDPSGQGDSCPVIVHTFRGGAVNFPLSLALAGDLEAVFQARVEGTANDNAVLLRIPRTFAGDAAAAVETSLRHLENRGRGERRFRERFESSGIFGAAFREAAERSLLLPRAPFGKRIPLWVLRQKSKRLFDAVSPYRDFPAAAEAWRSCLQDLFDMKGFAALLGDIESGAIGLGSFRTHRPSPFSRDLIWAETSVLMYEYDDRPDLRGRPGNSAQGPFLADRVIAEALGNVRFRPPIPAELAADFCSRLRREKTGWAPEDARTLCEWVKERTAIPSNGTDDECERLLKFISPELWEELQQDPGLGGRLFRVETEGAALIMHRDWVRKREKRGALKFAQDCLGQWLRHEGPLPSGRIALLFSLSLAEAEDTIRLLSEAGELVMDVEIAAGGERDKEAQGDKGGLPPLVYAGRELICDRENLELLLRLLRRKQRPGVQERPARLMAPFLARRQGLLKETGENVFPWEKLSGLSAPLKLWETEIFPCRSSSYAGEILDREIREGRLLWYGAGKEKAAFCGTGELDLVLPVSPPPDFGGRIPPDFFDALKSFWDIRDALGLDNTAAAAALWEEVWKGSLSADSFEAPRRALESGFVPLALSARDEGRPTRSAPPRIPRALRDRWRLGPPVRGSWFSLCGEEPDNETGGVLCEEERNQERVRILLGRWGVLCRPLLEREAPCFSWARLLPAMRRMELSGELVAGRFFGGVNSLQFASPRIGEELEAAEAERDVYWMNAADPASPAGLALEGLEEGGIKLPSRTASSRLCFRGTLLAALSLRGGKELELLMAPDDPELPQVLEFIKIPRMRNIQPEKKILVERINGKSAAASPYAAALAEKGFVKDRGRMILW